jgi:hypothetical protein
VDGDQVMELAEQPEVADLGWAAGALGLQVVDVAPGGRLVAAAGPDIRCG